MFGLTQGGHRKPGRAGVLAPHGLGLDVLTVLVCEPWSKKIVKWHFIRVYNCSLKDIVKRTKDKPQTGGRIFAKVIC